MYFLIFVRKVLVEVSHEDFLVLLVYVPEHDFHAAEVFGLIRFRWPKAFRRRSWWWAWLRLRKRFACQAKSEIKWKSLQKENILTTKNSIKPQKPVIKHQSFCQISKTKGAKGRQLRLMDFWAIVEGQNLKSNPNQKISENPPKDFMTSNQALLRNGSLEKAN